MHNFLIGALLFVLMFLALSFSPKKDYSHVPKEYRNLVHFAESAGY